MSHSVSVLDTNAAIQNSQDERPGDRSHSRSEKVPSLDSTDGQSSSLRGNLRGSNNDNNNVISLRSIEKPPSTRATGICFKVGFPLIVISSVVIAILFFTGAFDEKVEAVQESLGELFFDSDPFAGKSSAGNPEEAYAWANEGLGLELEIANHLDDSWQSFFNKAIQDWDSGEPDALSITTRKAEYDFDCEAERGILKVCNGDFGETDWRGINAIVLDDVNRTIFASAAKMNDFFLKKEPDAQKQYTMCHEIGHGFGLPHWDEDFYNRNLGNCMDYTTIPRTNQRPDTSNFEFLAVMYGTVDGTRTPTEPSTDNSVGWDSSGSPAFNPWWEDRRERNLRGSHGNRERLFSASVKEAYRAAMDDFEHPSWRKLHESDYGRALEMDLGEGFRLQAHMLKV